MKRRLPTLWEYCLLLAVFLLSGQPTVFPQKVTTKVKVYNEIFLTETGYAPLPENAIELEPEFTIRSDLFVSPLKLAVDREGNVFAASLANNALLQFSPSGEFKGQMGLNKNKRSDLKGPAGLSIVNEHLIVHEALRKRLDFMDLEGKQLRNRKIPEAEGFAVDEDGRIYLTPPVVNADSPLICVVSTDGTTAVFGRPLSFLHSLPMLNSRSLALDDHGNIYIAFRYFPIVRKYSTEGALIAEYRIESPIMEAKERYNLKAVGEGITDLSQRVTFKPLIIDIEASGDRLYLLSHIPRLEIVELDGTGNPGATYWMDSRDLYIANDLAMLEAAGTKTFYVARSNTPVPTIDVLKIKAQASSSLEADVQKWTTEINTYPNNSLAFINRGAARHQMGDHDGAILDFSKAIELDPSSALAFNNRGLSRVKLEDFVGATTDFSKAIELDPSVAAIYFNRGIAYIHGKNFLGAIEDFTMAAKLDGSYSIRAQEQIDYCKASLKKKYPLSRVRSTMRYQRAGGDLDLCYYSK